MRIVVVDDHEIVRQGLKALLEAEEDFSVGLCAGSDMNPPMSS
jgi:DNA-binding NarL/FixJ family response regulator